MNSAGAVEQSKDWIAVSEGSAELLEEERLLLLVGAGVAWPLRSEALAAYFIEIASRLSANSSYFTAISLQLNYAKFRAAFLVELRDLYAQRRVEVCLRHCPWETLAVAGAGEMPTLLQSAEEYLLDESAVLLKEKPYFVRTQFERWRRQAVKQTVSRTLPLVLLAGAVLLSLGAVAAVVLVQMDSPVVNWFLDK